MTFSNPKTLIAAALLAGLATAAPAATLGERLTSGDYSQGAFTQLIAGTGLSADEARSMTFEEVAKFRATDD